MLILREFELCCVVLSAWEPVHILQCDDRVVPSKFSDHFRGEKTWSAPELIQRTDFSLGRSWWFCVSLNCAAQSCLLGNQCTSCNVMIVLYLQSSPTIFVGRKPDLHQNWFSGQILAWVDHGDSAWVWIVLRSFVCLGTSAHLAMWWSCCTFKVLRPFSWGENLICIRTDCNALGSCQIWMKWVFQTLDSELPCAFVSACALSVAKRYPSRT